MTPNPYEPPRIMDSAAEPVAVTRESLTELIQSFLRGEISAFQFDEQLCPFHHSSDSVIRHVAQTSWYYYDDCADHYVRLSKAGWDHFQRLLLALATNSQIETSRVRHWSFRQAIALLALVVYAGLALRAGWGAHLLVLAIPFGAISIALSKWRAQSLQELEPLGLMTLPFASYRDLATAYKQTDFRKARYPTQLDTREVRPRWLEGLDLLRMYALWLVAAPIPLLFQVLPETRSESRIVTRTEA